MSQAQQPPYGTPANPHWWRLPIVWMVIGGPALVVLACIVTVTLAVKHVDPVLDTSKGEAKSVNAMPAVKVRNHAAAPEQLPVDR